MLYYCLIENIGNFMMKAQDDIEIKDFYSLYHY